MRRFRPLNLTQLRRNKRTRYDKVSGRKRPRPDDVDVIPAADGDEDTAEALVQAIQAQPQSPPHSDVEPDNDDTDLCGVCGRDEPPARSSGRAKVVRWVQCEKCPRWFHNVCVGLRSSKAVKTFVCTDC